METKPRILIVDDEPQIVRVLTTGLIANGYDTRYADNGFDALEIAASWSPDVIVTDLVMPGMTGLELCRQIRADSETPIVVLSVKGEERIKVEALDAGADDYVTKPFGIEELLARLRAVQRRSRTRPSETVNILSSGDLRIDLDSREVTVDEKTIHLTPKEYDLLVYFVSHPGKVLTQRTLL
ncbi:MAG TPA: response regulator transcription factor, partial [Pyrinomonadaceae bacterium]|nr:response regulator transcription factor [Pyrinomonadaceae bacterium]